MDVPPIFKAIQKASGTSDSEMFEVYNMGHRMEVYCSKSDAKKVIEIAESYSIQARVIGHTEKWASRDSKNDVRVKYAGKTLEYGPRD